MDLATPLLEGSDGALGEFTMYSSESVPKDVIAQAILNFFSVQGYVVTDNDLDIGCVIVEKDQSKPLLISYFFNSNKTHITVIELNLL